jgi:hypothetical protein
VQRRVRVLVSNCKCVVMFVGFLVIVIELALEVRSGRRNSMADYVVLSAIPISPSSWHSLLCALVPDHWSGAVDLEAVCLSCLCFRELPTCL